jgi:pimeloyl-ACP methyl ester carboxylesterase
MVWIGRILAALVLLFCAYVAVGGAMTAAHPVTPRGEMIDIGGRRLRIVCDGPKSASPTVILEAGSFGLAADWAEVQKRLTVQGVRSCAYDRAGMGFSDPGPQPRDGVAIVSDLEKLLKAADVPGPYVLVGHSMAGLHVRLFAVRNPQPVAGLVLVDAAGWPDETLKKPPLAFRIMMSKPGRWYLERGETVPITAAALKADFHNPALATKPFAERWVAVQRAPGHRRILMSLQFGPDSVATKEKLAAITTPTLILHGRDVHIIAPISAEKFKDGIPGSELVLYPDTGHLPQWEQPDRTATDIGSFVDRRAKK